MAPVWQKAPFDEFLVLQRGADLTKSQFQSGDIPVAGSNGVIGYHNKANVAAPGVTVGRSGSVGKVSIYHRPFWAHNTCLYVRDFRGNDELFSYFFLQYLDVGRFKSGASVPTLDRNTFRFLPVTFPPADEQRQIARLLSAVQRAIEWQERLIALTAELKKALMHKLFTEGTCGEPLKQTEIGPVPESWVVERFDARFEAKLGKMLSQKGRSGEHAFPYLRNKNIQWGGIDLDDLLEMDFDARERQRFELRIGDLLVCEGGEPGRAAIWEGAPFACYYQKALHRVRPLNGTATNEYLLCWLTYAIGTRNLYGTAGASSTIAHLPLAQLNALPVPFPSRAEQDAIAEALAAISRVERLRRAMRSSLETLFRTLLHQLMTAQIRVHDLDLSPLDEPVAEPAEVA